MEFTKWVFLGLGVLVLVGLAFAQGTSDSNDGFGQGEQYKEQEGFKKVTEPLKEQIEGVKNKLEQFKDEAKQRLEKYKEQKEKWEESKKGFSGLGLMLDSNDGRKVTVEYMQTLGAKIQDHLEKMQDKNGKFTEFFNSKVDEVNTVLAELDENSTKEEIVLAINEVKSIWNNSLHQRKVVIAQKYLEGVDKVTSKVENALNSLDSKLDKIEAANIDTNEARTQYYKAVESLANLKLEITTTKELLDKKLSDANVDVNSVNSILKNLKDAIHTATFETKKAVVEYNQLKNDFAKQNKKDKDQNKIQERTRDANTHDDDSNTENEDVNEQTTDSENNSNN